MKILAVEASGPVAGCAVLEDGLLIADYNVQYKKKHAQSLVPMMEEVRRMLELDLGTVDAIAVAKGPGSFTGLRIGAATVKGAAMAMDVPVIPVPTVDSIAYNLYGTDALICPLMDARRSQVYTGIYEWRTDSAPKPDPQPLAAKAGAPESAPRPLAAKAGAPEWASQPLAAKASALNSELLSRAAQTNLEQPQALWSAPRFFVLRPQCVVPVGEIAQDLNERGRPVIFLGDGVPVMRGALSGLMKVPYSFAPAHLARQRAAAVAALAFSYYEEQGEACMISAEDFRPEYLRLAQAEQEHSERRNFSLL